MLTGRPFTKVAKSVPWSRLKPRRKYWLAFPSLREPSSSKLPFAIEGGGPPSRFRRSADGSRCLECKGKECSDSQKRERHEIVPRELLFEKEDREHNEHRDRNHLLDDLELKSRELSKPEAIGRHRQAVLEQCDSPGNEDGFPQRPIVAVLQMAIPGEGHEDVRKHQEKYRAHRFSLRKVLSLVSGMK